METFFIIFANSIKWNYYYDICIYKFEKKFIELEP